MAKRWAKNRIETIIDWIERKGPKPWRELLCDPSSISRYQQEIRTRLNGRPL